MEPEDGIFEPGFNAPGGGSGGSATTTADADNDGESEDSESGPDTSDSADATTGGEDEASSDGGAVNECPDALLDTGYTCPSGSTFSTGDGFARCMFEQIPLPTTASVSPYCQYLDDGYLGFSWSLDDVAAHACPAEARYAPTDTTGYCLWEDLPLPPVDVTPDCNALVVGGGLGFRWACPG